MATTAKREAINTIRKEFCDKGQGHVFNWWDELTADERERLVGQIETIDLDLIKELTAGHLTPQENRSQPEIQPAPVISLPRTAEKRKRARNARARGEELIRSGHTAAFVVAGGQGSRLGFRGPKGKVPITPVLGKSLFQHHVEKISALSKKYLVSIPFFIMTSQSNHDETIAFFEENEYFGFPREDVFFLMQEMLPAVDRSGKFILQDKGSLFMSPDGHGGSLRTLYKQGAVEEMEKRGIRYLFYFQVDNPLVKILDPIFLGYHDLEKAEMSSKVVEKKEPEEKVGVHGIINGKAGVIEYSDMTPEDMAARDEKGKLRFSAGSIAVHIINVGFIKRCTKGSFRLPYHKAEKNIPYIDESGDLVTPKDKNGIKFETFVFDALRFAKKTTAMEVVREEEFSPVKNAEGDNSPESASEALSNLFCSWMKKAGFQTDGEESQRIEISPLFALDREEFVDKIKKKHVLLSSKLFIQ